MRLNTRAFTIIETLLFLAVSALLVLIITVGRGAAVRRAQFTDTIESLQSKLIRLQREQFSTFSTGTGTDANNVNFMTVVRFTEGSSDVRVERCTTNRTNGPRNPASGVYNVFSCTQTETFRLKWEAVYGCQEAAPANCSNTVVYYVHHENGSLKTDGVNSSLFPLDVQEVLTSGYGNDTARMTAVGIRSADGVLRGAILLNDTGNPAGIGALSNRTNQIGKVFR